MWIIVATAREKIENIGKNYMEINERETTPSELVEDMDIELVSPLCYVRLSLY